MFETRRTSSAVVPSLIAALAWGAMFPIASVALEHVDPFVLTAIRYGVGVVIFLLLLRVIEGRNALRPDGRARELFILGSLGFAGFNLLSYVGLEHTHPQNAALIVALQPLVTAVGLWITTRQLPGRHTFIAMAVALVGVTLVITRGKPGSLLSGDGHLGELLVLTGCASWIAYTLGARRFADFSPLRYTALSATYGTLTIFAATAIALAIGWERVPSLADLGAAWWHTIYIIAAGAVIAVLAWNEGVRRIGPANAALFLNLVPIISFAIAISIQGYDPNAFELVGALITIGALVYANLAGREQALTPPSRLAWPATRPSRP
jgi:drug/metabolite transporter (DMT)-like permease